MTSSVVSRRLAVVAVSAAIAALLAACGSPDPQATTGHDHPSAATAAHEHGSGATGAPTSVAPDANSADVAFARMMIPHHQQAIDMAELVPARTQNAWLRSFAQQVTAVQGPEIQQLETALNAWGQAAATTTGHGHEMDGMMTTEQLAQLESLSGDAFDREWITLMIAHHRGAVAMAQTELAQGQNPEMRALAQQIIGAQQAEIAEMQAQLKR